MFCLVYELTNSVNNKKYIGQTWQTLEQRWNRGHGYVRCTLIGRAIKKYGIDNFSYKILTVCHTQIIADYYEQYFISLFDTMTPDNGYNLTLGGSRGKFSEESKRKLSQSKMGKNNPMFGKAASEETKKKMSNSRLGRIVSAETKEKISKANKGRAISEEQKKIISKANSGRKMSEDNLQKLIKINTGRIVSAETREKLAALQRGRKHSNESKLKMSETKKRKK